MPEYEKLVYFRCNDRTLRVIDRIAQLEKKSRTKVVEELLDIGIDGWLFENDQSGDLWDYKQRE